MIKASWDLLWKTSIIFRFGNLWIFLENGQITFRNVCLTFWFVVLIIKYIFQRSKRNFISLHSHVNILYIFLAGN